MIGYGDSCDREDEYLHLSETETANSVKEFSRFMVHEFGEHYLCRTPTDEERERVLKIFRERGFPGGFSSWDTKHFQWKNCPVRLAGQHKGHAEGGKKTLILETIADPDLYLWSIFFGEAGSLNDINVLDKSSIVLSILNGKFDLKTDEYEINGHLRNWLYFLADGIYPDWAIFVKTFQCPLDEKESYFAQCQESARKDVERAFAVLILRFQILQRAIRMWYLEDICNLLYCCVIMHNMVVEERRQQHPETPVADWMERNVASLQVNTQEEPTDCNVSGLQEDTNRISLFGEAQDPSINAEVYSALAERVATVSRNMMDSGEHRRLREDLMNHLWERHQAEK
jgi:hypothetical protein